MCLLKEGFKKPISVLYYFFDIFFFSELCLYFYEDLCVLLHFDNLLKNPSLLTRCLAMVFTLFVL